MRLSDGSYGEIIEKTAFDVHPPLYYVLLRAWRSLFGNSLVAARAMSTATAAAGILGVFSFIREANTRSDPHGRREAPGSSPLRHEAGALAGAALFALNPLQIEYGQSARMYSLGATLVAWSCWCLLRALRSPVSAASPIWPFLGLLTAALVYTHYFAATTVVGLCAFAAAWVLWKAREGDWENVRGACAGAAASAMTAIVLCSAWLPALLHQLANGRDAFWVRTSPWETLTRSAALLVAGNDGDGWRAAVLVFGMCAMLVWAVVRSSLPDALLGACVLATPIALSLAAYHCGARPFLVERRLLFPQIGFFAMVGCVAAASRRFPVAIALVAFLISANAIGAARQLRSQPHGPPAIDLAARRLSRDYRPGDVVVVPEFIDVFRLKAYLRGIGSTDVDVRCSFPDIAGRPWRRMMAVPLAGGEILHGDDVIPEDAKRVWLASPHRTSWRPDNADVIVDVEFRGSASTYYSLRLMQRRSTPTAPIVRGGASLLIGGGAP